MQVIKTKTSQTLLFCLVWVCVCIPAHAQVVKLTDEDTFSEDAVALTFEELLTGAIPGEAYAAYGVKFLSETGTLPGLRWVPMTPGFVPSGDRAIRNESSDGSSPNGSLIIQLEYPLRRIGLTLDHPEGTEELIASIQAYNAKAELLGTIEQIVPTRPESLTETFRPVFVGVEATHPEGISTLVVSYEEMGVEQVNEILLDYLTPRIFRTYIPQIVQGAETLFTERLQIIGRQFGANVTASFFDQEGAPLSFTFNGVDSHEFFFTLPSGNAYELRSDGSEGQVKVGYAVIESNHPVAAQATYRITGQNEGHISELGILDREASLIHFAPVERAPGISLDTGIAVINAGDSRTFVWLVPHTPEGIPDEIITWPGFGLEAGAFRAFFLSELCQQPDPAFGNICRPDFLVTEDFQGSLRFRSVEPVVVLTLQTINGLPSSSLPVISD